MHNEPNVKGHFNVRILAKLIIGSEKKRHHVNNYYDHKKSVIASEIALIMIINLDFKHLLDFS